MRSFTRKRDGQFVDLLCRSQAGRAGSTTLRLTVHSDNTVRNVRDHLGCARDALRLSPRYPGRIGSDFGIFRATCVHDTMHCFNFAPVIAFHLGRNTLRELYLVSPERGREGRIPAVRESRPVKTTVITCAAFAINDAVHFDARLRAKLRALGDRDLQ